MHIAFRSATLLSKTAHSVKDEVCKVIRRGSSFSLQAQRLPNGPKLGFFLALPQHRTYIDQMLPIFGQFWGRQLFDARVEVAVVGCRLAAHVGKLFPFSPEPMVEELPITHPVGFENTLKLENLLRQANCLLVQA